ncbi:PREDICTED: indolethylamine N-methyltransferase-like, partial [Nanorana parkeri]|uniref:indolethylamine N-methyltransferase-like n=1 Tax=Nanorana parkeri TaxID=125878 RepID=UPI0008546A86
YIKGDAISLGAVGHRRSGYPARKMSTMNVTTHKHYNDPDLDAKEYIKGDAISLGAVGHRRSGYPARKMSTMNVTTHKHYNDPDLDAKELVNTHFSHGKISIIEETMGFPTRVIHDLASKGELKGEKVLDISIGSIPYQLFSVSSFVKEIYVVQMTDTSFRHFNQWLEKDNGATDWSHASKRVCHLEGNRQGWQEKEDQTSSLIKGVYKWDNYETNSLDPALVPQVDCVITLWILNVISKTKDDLLKNLVSLTSRLKAGGQLLVFMVLDMTFYMVGSHRYFCLTLDEKELQELVIKAGFIIEKSSLLRGVEPNDIVDYSHMCCVLARKIKEA